MDSIVRGIVLKTVNYKEADKIASIFTLEEGIIPAKFTGVRRDKAKLKAMSQPFSFCEFGINKSKEHRTITSASPIDLFNNILIEYNRMMCGYIVLDMVRSIVPEEKPEPELFLQTINSLKNIETNEPLSATIDYILKFMYYSGVGLVFPESSYVYLSRASGEFSTNRDEFSYEVDKRVYDTLRNLNNGEVVESNPKILTQILKMLHNIIYAKFNVEISSFGFI